ncbi:uncharacterized protein [Dermacentor albipictus]|uniref:uncharacterized protein n=1 Tax=Dermacentor albipictus TaxID=60249 RepID=UPI0038FC8526
MLVAAPRRHRKFRTVVVRLRALRTMCLASLMDILYMTLRMVHFAVRTEQDPLGEVYAQVNAGFLLFGFLAVPPICGVTWLGTASSDLAPLAVEHVDVIECLPKNCAIAAIRDYLGASHFKLQHASHPKALSYDQPIIDNSRSVTSAADGINVQRVDRLFSGLGCSGTGTMFNRCLLFMQLFGFLAVPPICGVTWLGTASSDLAPLAVEHVDVIECLPKNCAIAAIRDYLGASHFKLQHASHPKALSYDQPIIDNSRSVTSAADGINVQRVDRLFSGLGCSGTGTMFNRCLLFMQEAPMESLVQLIEELLQGVCGLREVEQQSLELERRSHETNKHLLQQLLAALVYGASQASMPCQFRHEK